MKGQGVHICTDGAGLEMRGSLSVFGLWKEALAETTQAPVMTGGAIPGSQHAPSTCVWVESTAR